MPDPESHELATFDLLGLEGGASPSTFRLDVRPELCTPFGFLYGGSGIAASVEASERATGRPLQWITTQFVGSPAPGDVVDVEVVVSATGRSTTQTQVHGTIGGSVAFTSLCAHNVRPAGDERAFATMPVVDEPEACDPFAELFDTGVAGSFFDHFERRVAAGRVGPDADGDPQDGPLAIWCRLTTTGIGSAATQGFVADLGPLALCAAMGIAPGGTSLDNTIRVVDARASEWVLIEIAADGFHRSVGHSTARTWSRDGRLLGIAQQSAIIRRSHHDRIR
ncbi:acyl-CoA thioesterase [Ilumatobacter sp.]|uniref:acyl-CoA thioesterase n=1 Tax=Ilumatobacter sp. TaxID=1967498 RepID=UPI003B52872F